MITIYCKNPLRGSRISPGQSAKINANEIRTHARTNSNPCPHQPETHSRTRSRQSLNAGRL